GGGGGWEGGGGAPEMGIPRAPPIAQLAGPPLTHCERAKAVLILRVWPRRMIERKGAQMQRAQELAIIRLAYAKQILAAAQVNDQRLEQAFAQVPREDFLGPGPWMIPRWFDDYLPTPTDDPVY